MPKEAIRMAAALSFMFETYDPVSFLQTCSQLF